MDYAFDFWKKYGIMTYDDYPYTSRDSGVEGECNHDETSVEGYVLDHGQIYGSTDDVKVALVALNGSAVHESDSFAVIPECTAAEGAEDNVTHVPLDQSRKLSFYSRFHLLIVF